MSGHKRIAHFILFSLLLSSCREKKEEVFNNTIAVKIVNAQEKFLDNELSSFGTISYKLKNDITALVEGTIYSFPVKDGQHIKSGSVIARLRNLQLEIQKSQCLSSIEAAKASYDLTSAQYNESVLAVESKLLSIEKSELTIKQKEVEFKSKQKTFEKQKSLYEIGGVTDYNIEQLELELGSLETELKILRKEQEISCLGFRKEDLIFNGIVPSEDDETFHKQIVELNTRTAKAQVASAKAQLDSAEQQLKSVELLLEQLTIKSPVSGIVGQKYYENGEYVKENEKILTLIDTSSVDAVIYIQEKDIVNFSIGTQVNIEIPSLNKNVKSTISEISPIADSQSGNFSVKASIGNSDNLIKPGMFVKCRFQKNEPEQFPCIPNTAIIQGTDNSAKVICVIKNSAVIKNITIKEQKNGYVWISDGIEKNEIIVNNPSPFIREGQLVEIVK